MPLPYSFILSLLVLLGSEHLDDGLPRPVSWSALLPWLPLLVVPYAVSQLLLHRHLLLASGLPVPSPSLRLCRMLQFASMPLVYMVILDQGKLHLLARQWAGRSYLLDALVLLSPLILMELSTAWGERRLLRRSDPGGAAPAIPTNPHRIALVVLLLFPLLMFSAGMDMLFLSRSAAVFLGGTSVGGLLGFLLFVAALCVVLPVLFRWLMPVSSHVPAHVRAMASSLGFGEKSVLAMATGHRMVNAALVGPLPWPRYLVLTDGLLALLDPMELKGVVAHEVGHAKAGHPLLLMLLFVLVPLLLLHPLEVLDIRLLDTWVLVTLATVAVLLVLFLLRLVAHRFEFEADFLSARALGGSAPCIQALRKVGSIFPGAPYRASIRHPSEDRRIQRLLACDFTDSTDSTAEYRDKFLRRGRLLRGGILLAVLASLLLCTWAQWTLWPVDRAIMAFYTGRFPAVEQALQQAPADLPSRQIKFLRELREELLVARTFYPDGGEWEAIREELAGQALARGRQLLGAEGGGGAAARPWLAVGMIKSDPTPEEISLYLYCQAIADEDAEMKQRLIEHLTSQFDLPTGLRQAIDMGK